MNLRFPHTFAIVTLATTCAAVAGLGLPAAAQVVPPAPTSVPDPLSLSQAISIALAHQPQQYIAATQRTSASGTVTQAQAQYFPAVTPSYTYEHDSAARFASGIGHTNNTTSGSTVSVDITQQIFDTGKRELTNAQARRGVDVAKYNSVDVQQQVIDNVTRDYYNLLRAIDLVKVAESQVKSAQTEVDQVQAQITAGTSAAASIYQARATLANSQVTLLQDQTGVTNASATLKNDLGVDSNSVVDPVPLVAGDQLPPPPPSTPEKSLADYVAIAYANRPDLKAQQAEVERQNEAVKIAQLGTLPQLAGTYDFVYDPVNDFGTTGSDSRLMLTASYPLFDAGSSRAAVRIAQASRDAAKDTLQADQNNVHLAVEQALATRTQALNSATLAQTALQAAQVNYDSAVAQQREGLLTVVDVITAQATLAQAQQNYVGTVYDFYVADAALRRAIGQNDVPASSTASP
jgi:outer membrane protein TolC